MNKLEKQLYLFNLALEFISKPMSTRAIEYWHDRADDMCILDVKGYTDDVWTVAPKGTLAICQDFIRECHIACPEMSSEIDHYADEFYDYMYLHGGRGLSAVNEVRGMLGRMMRDIIGEVKYCYN